MGFVEVDVEFFFVGGEVLDRFTEKLDLFAVFNLETHFVYLILF